MYFDYKCCKLQLQDMSLVNEVDMALFAIPRLMVGSSMFVPWYYKSIVWGNYLLNDTVKNVGKMINFWRQKFQKFKLCRSLGSKSWKSQEKQINPKENK